MKLVIGYFYPELLNLYGDNGNIEILAYRAAKRGFDVQVIPIHTDTNIEQLETGNINLVFMGGGPDSAQKGLYQDLIKNKKQFLKDYVDNRGVGLFICGAYQLLGQYYKSADGSMLEGLGIFDLYTEHFGNHKPRCIGNLVVEFDEAMTSAPVFKKVNKLSNTLVGFENHGGRTYLGVGVKPFGRVVKGFGNNGEDQTEGAVYKNSIGTYSHGPILSKNPHLADYLIASALKIDELEPLDDEIINIAHANAKKLK